MDNIGSYTRSLSRRFQDSPVGQFAGQAGQAIGDFAQQAGETYSQQFVPFAERLGATAAMPDVNKQYDEIARGIRDQMDLAFTRSRMAETPEAQQQALDMLNSLQADLQQAEQERQELLGQGGTAGQVLPEALRAGLATVGTATLAGSPAMMAGYGLASGGIGGAVEKLTGGDFLTGAAKGVGEAPTYAGGMQVGRALAQPLVSRLVPDTMALPQGIAPYVRRLTDPRTLRFQQEVARQMVSPEVLARNIAGAGLQTGAGSALLGAVQPAETPQERAKNIAVSGGVGFGVGAGGQALTYGLQAAGVGAQRLGEAVTRKLAGKGREAYEFISPQKRSGLNYKQATRELDTPRQNEMRQFNDAVDKQMRLKSKSTDGIGDWSPEGQPVGSENTIVNEVKNVKDWNQLKYNTAVKAKEMEQISAIPFIEQKNGTDRLYFLDLKSKDVPAIQKTLNSAGLPFRTIVDQKGGTRIIIFNMGGDIDEVGAIKPVLDKYGGDAFKIKGKGDFIGHDSSREKAQKIYDQIIAKPNFSGQRYDAEQVRQSLSTVRQIPEQIRQQQGGYIKPFANIGDEGFEQVSKSDLKKGTNSEAIKGFVNNEKVGSKNIWWETESDGSRVVYSYGRHFPMARIAPDGTVQMNVTKFSPTTSNQQSQLRRLLESQFGANNIQVMNTDELKSVLSNVRLQTPPSSTWKVNTPEGKQVSQAVARKMMQENPNLQYATPAEQPSSVEEAMVGIKGKSTGGVGSFDYKTVKIDSPQAKALQNKGYKVIDTFSSGDSPMRDMVQFEIPKTVGGTGGGKATSDIYPSRELVKSLTKPNRKWFAEVVRNPDTSKLEVLVSDGNYAQNPIKYESGQIGYDDPYQVPAYAKKLVKQAFESIKNIVPAQSKFDTGGVVKLADDALQQHARSVPPQMGYTAEEFGYRDALKAVKGIKGMIERIYDSGASKTGQRAVVNFGGRLIDVPTNFLNRLGK